MEEKLRYTQIEFPLYRFIPGENPHPTENPSGHSYGKEEKKLTAFDPAQWQRTEPYLYGVDLYNHGYWWESHEAFEGLWRVTAREDIARDCLQGLIKISGGFIKWHLKKRRGLEDLYKGAMEHLLKVGKGNNHYMGVNIPAHINKLEKHFSKAISSSDGEWPDLTAGYPDIILELADKG